MCANGNIPETAGETHRLGGQALSVELPQLKEHCLPALIRKVQDDQDFLSTFLGPTTTLTQHFSPEEDWAQ